MKPPWLVSHFLVLGNPINIRAGILIYNEDRNDDSGRVMARC